MFAWIKAERQIYMEDEVFTREMRRHPELGVVAELGLEEAWGAPMRLAGGLEDM